MLPPYVSDVTLHTFLHAAFNEDVGDGDHSSLASIPENLSDEAILLMKDHGIIAGVELARRIFSHYDDQLIVETYSEDGDSLKPGNHVLKVAGSARSILACERLVLNCMQRMSGIATYTHRLMSMIDHTRARLLDTRKTTPNFRMMEKWAVVIGGGVNHRFGLYDMIMLKDNHIDFAGGISEAINAAIAYVKKNNLSLKIEIETRNLEEVRQVISHGRVDRIMLDNMSVDDMHTAVELINDVYETEASGGINEDTIGHIAETGVNYISVGALTHSVASLDMSLKAIKHLKQ